MGGVSPDQVVIDLLVGDGDKTRYQRNALLNPNLKRIGVAYGKHQTFGECTVIVLYSYFKNNIDADDKYDYKRPESGPKYIPPGGYNF